MPRGGRRAGSGRKKGSTIKKTQIIAAEARDAGITPLDYMLQIVRSSDADQARRDQMAVSSAPFCHPRLNAVASLDASDTGGSSRLELTIVAVPRGGQYDPKTGKIVYADGTVAEPPPFQPFEPTPDLEPMPGEPTPVAQLAGPVDHGRPTLVIDNELDPTDDAPPGAA
jgi:hypothetical protein